MDRYRRSSMALYGYSRVQLQCQRVHKLKAKRGGGARVDILRQADPIIAYHENVGRFASLEAHGDRAVHPPLEGVFHRIREQLSDDETKRDGRIDVEPRLVDLDLQLDTLRARKDRLQEIRRQLLHVRSEVNLREIFAQVELLVHERDRADPISNLLENLDVVSILEILALEGDEARNHGKIVLNAMVDLFQQDLFLAERALDLGLRAHLLRDVGHEYDRGGAVFILDGKRLDSELALATEDCGIRGK